MGQRAEIYALWKNQMISGEDIAFWQEIFVKFYQAFIEADRWTQYLNGVGTTLMVTAMALLSKAYEDTQIIDNINKERDEWVELLKERARIFTKEAKKVGLEICPFRGGFFITVPLEKNKNEIVEDLKTKKTFVLPIKKGLRVAICSISCKKLEILPKLIKESIDKFND